VIFNEKIFFLNSHTIYSYFFQEDWFGLLKGLGTNFFWPGLIIPRKGVWFKVLRGKNWPKELGSRGRRQIKDFKGGPSRKNSFKVNYF